MNHRRGFVEMIEVFRVVALAAEDGRASSVVVVGVSESQAMSEKRESEQDEELHRISKVFSCLL